MRPRSVMVHRSEKGDRAKGAWADPGGETFTALVLTYLSAELLAFFGFVSYSPNLPFLPLCLIHELEAFLVLHDNFPNPPSGLVPSVFSPLAWVVGFQEVHRGGGPSPKHYIRGP